MHQPSYRAADGEYRQPWVYLHAIKDYADMAWHLERNEAARATVSFAPVLLEQLDDYVAQFTAKSFRDPLLRAFQRGGATTPDEQRKLSYMLCRANYERMVRRYPAFERLFHLAETAAWGGQPLSPADLADALVWYHLVWLGEATRRTDSRVQALIAKARGYSGADRATLLEVIEQLVCGIVARYRALAQAGRIEVSTTPYSHPIVPLLIDFAAARDSRPQTPLPSAGGYPGGLARADAQLDSARAAHAAHFGALPRGCWPSEGGVSLRTLEALRRGDFAWAASSEMVLANSLRAQRGQPGNRADYLYTPYAVRTDSGPIACFFRDDDLSDRIGFVYAPWRAGDAIADLTAALEAIARNGIGSQRVVTIVLDGENAWEHYADNAFEFLSALYQHLGSSERVRLTTLSDALAHAMDLPELDRIVAGSWVFGTLETWVGDPDKNRGWDLLCAAKHAYDDAVVSGALGSAELARAEMLLRRCESSDWFWWFGGYNPSAPVRDFEQLFRQHLRDLYDALGRPTPAQLDEPVSVGTGAPVYDGVMRPVWEAKAN